MDNIQLSSNRVLDLEPREKMDLFSFTHTSTAKALYKLMENLIIDARDEAMAVDPVDEKLQKSRIDGAHWFSVFYTRVRKSIESSAMEHIGELQRFANEEILTDRDQIENIILDQAVNPISAPRPQAQI